MSATPDRMKESLAAILSAMLPRLLYLATWEYRCLSADPGPPVTIDAQAVDAGTEAALPQHLSKIVLWPGPSGGIAVPKPGTIVRIAFVNGDPTKPAVVGLDPNATPLSVVLDASTRVNVGDSAPHVQLAGGGSGIALATTLDPFINVFLNEWIPVPMDGGAALKTALAAWALGPPPFVTSGSMKATTG